MAHQPDGTDTVGGLYTAGPPKSLITHNDLNMPFQEINNVILEALMTLESSSAADAAAGWKQLLQAIRILAGRPGNSGQSGNPHPILTNGFDLGDPNVVNLTTFTTSLIGLAFNNVFTGGFVGGSEIILDDSSNYARKIILIRNDTVYPLSVFDAHYGALGITLAIGQLMFLQFDGTGWCGLSAPQTTDELTEGSINLYYTAARFNTAFGAKTLDNLPDGTGRMAVLKDTGSFTIHLFDAANVDIGNGTATYEVIDGHVLLTLHGIAGTATMTGAARLADATGSSLPASVRTTGDYYGVMLANDTTGNVIGAFRITTGNIIAIPNLTAGVVEVQSQILKYKNT